VHKAKQGEKSGLRQRWSWVEASIWTDRMLTALENGVKGGKWFSLIDKVHSLRAREQEETLEIISAGPIPFSPSKGFSP